MHSVAPDPTTYYIADAGLRGASGAISPGPYRSLRELSLTGLVGSVTWRPPTFVGNPGSMLQRPSRLRTYLTMPDITETGSLKTQLREQAFARRDALPADARAAAAEALAA